MTAVVVWTTASDRDRAETLSEALDQTLEPGGVGVFEIEDGSGRWEVTGYFAEAPDAVALSLLAAAHGAADFVVSSVEDRDWVAQVRRELTPVRAGRIVVYGRHDRDALRANDVALEIEAAMAFGTGHHGTTEGCLLALERLIKSGWRPGRDARAADIGCGTGVLAMAAARRLALRARPAVIATDLDSIAVSTARANVAANGLSSRILVRQAAGTRDAELLSGGPYALIFANILAKPLKTLAPQLQAATAPGGRVVLSGLLERQANDVLASYRAHRYALDFDIRLRGWRTLVLSLSR